jgi:hypothetical protein
MNWGDLLAVPGTIVSILVLYKMLRVFISRRKHKTGH